MTYIFPLKLEAGTAYVLTAEVAAVFPTQPPRFDRCLVYVDNHPGPYEVLQPVQQVADQWRDYLEDDSEESSDE